MPQKKKGATTKQRSLLPASTPIAEAVPPSSSDGWAEALHQLDSQVEGPPKDKLGYAEFELDFEHALARQLGPFFEKLEPLKLNPENVENVVPLKSRGAYYLLLNGEVVYIGKSDAKAGLRARLLRHYKTLRRRQGIDWDQMKFKAVKVGSLAALDTESLLIDLFKRRAQFTKTKSRPIWNQSGFGSNDTGKERDTQRVSIFDQNHPLDLNAIIDLDKPLPVGNISLAAFMKWLAPQLSFTFRRDTQRASMLQKIQVDPAEMCSSLVLSDLLGKIHAKLPPDWVLTVLRGKVVLYHNDTSKYKSPVWRLVSAQDRGTPDYTLGDVGSPEPEPREETDDEPEGDGG